MAIASRSYLHVLVQCLLLLTFLQRKRFINPHQHHQQTEDTQQTATRQGNGKRDLLQVWDLLDQSVEQGLRIGEIAAEDGTEETA